MPRKSQTKTAPPTIKEEAFDDDSKELVNDSSTKLTDSENGGSSTSAPTDIHSYLAGFQKEISAASNGDGIVVTPTPRPRGRPRKSLTIAKGTHTSTPVKQQQPTKNNESRRKSTRIASASADKAASVESTPVSTASTIDGSEFLVDADSGDDGSSTVANGTATAQTAGLPVPNTDNQIVINSGNAFQRVTVVPANNNSDEMSYVLIVQEPDTKDGDNDVYDFNEREEPAVTAADSEPEDDKSNIIKIVPKKSQTVAQTYMCNFCNYTSPKRYLLSRHMKSHSEERPHKCTVCERGFKTVASLQNHVNTHTGTRPHQCKFCKSAFTTSGELVRHVRYRHTHEKPHKCPECDYASVELSKLKRHIRCHTGERPYQCPHCTYASPDTFKLKRHLRIHTGEKPYECDICNTKFTQSNSLKAHKLTHNIGNKPVFHCQLCPTTCGRKTDLRIHIQKLHTSDKPLKCKRCGKTFPDRYSFKVHNKSHEGEKCFKCDLCPYASISARHLESHMLIHTDQKPYTCHICEQAFRQKQLLKRHQNLYHNPEYVPPQPREKTHECPDCTRAFRHKGNLIRHLATHSTNPQTRLKQIALREGRQKRIHIVDGQQIEVITGPRRIEIMGEPFDDEFEDEEDEDEDDDLMEGFDGEEDGEEVGAENVNAMTLGDHIDMVALEGAGEVGADDDDDAANGEQYVVLEVIQLSEGDEQSLTAALQPTADDDDDDTNFLRADGILPHSVGLDENDEGVLDAFDEKRLYRDHVVKIENTSFNAENDMKNCFGFDDEDDDEDIKGKQNISLLNPVD